MCCSLCGDENMCLCAHGHLCVSGGCLCMWLCVCECVVVCMHGMHTRLDLLECVHVWVAVYA